MVDTSLLICQSSTRLSAVEGSSLEVGKSFLRLFARSCRNRRLKPAHWTFLFPLYYAARCSLCRDQEFCESNPEIFAATDAG